MADKFPSWKQALITFFGGIVLAGSTCFGFLLTLESNDALGSFMAIGFGLSLIVILAGFVFVVIRIVRAMTEKGPSTAAPPPPLPPAEPGASA